MNRLVIITLLVASCSGVTGTTAGAKGDAPWYWTPGWCKHVLQNYGMELSDGRTFNVAKAFCVGEGGPSTCEWSSGYQFRLYSAFNAISRSFDGTVRVFVLHATGRQSYQATNIRAVANIPDPYRFEAFVAPLTHEWAAEEHQKGCAPYQP